MARAPAFQAGYAGSIPVTRSAERPGQRVFLESVRMTAHGGHLVVVVAVGVIVFMVEPH